jgi:hypothetical protein
MYSAMMAAGAYGTAQYSEERIGVNPYDAVVPNPMVGMVFGMSLPKVKHKDGLYSGGAIGYSTFATGVGPESGFARQISLGNMGLQATRAMAHGLSKIPGIAGSESLSPYLNVAKQAHRLGLAGMAGTVDASTVEETAQTAARKQLRTGRFKVTGGGGMHQKGIRTFDVAPDGSVRAGMHPDLKQVDRVSAFKGQGGRGPLKRGMDPEATFSAMEKLFGENKTARYLGGILGGTDKVKGFQRIGSKIAPILDDTIDGGFKIGGGALGAGLGKLIKFGGYVELANIAVDIAAYGAGKAYGTLTNVTREMNRRFDPNAMSSGYFNQAAATERQRAVMKLDSSRLAPRTQLMGNGAFHHHR